MRRTGWIATGVLVAAFAATLSGCKLPPICAELGGKNCVELNHPPTLQLGVTYAAFDLLPVPKVGDVIIFTAKASDADGDDLLFEWDMNADGRFETTTGQDPEIRRIYGTPGTRRVAVRVTDYPQLGGGEGRATATISVMIYTEEDARSSHRPVASFTATVERRNVHLDASASSDPDGDRIALYRWDFDADGFYDLETGNPFTTRTFAPGVYEIRLRVVDAAGFQSERVQQTVTVQGECTPPSCPGAAGGERAKSRALLFSARLEGGSLRATLLHLPGRASWAERTLRSFLRTALRPRLKTRGYTRSGIALAKGRRGARACVRVSLVIKPGAVPTGRLEVIGGTGAAARLHATARFRFGAGRAGSAIGLGTVRASRGGVRPLAKTCTRR